MAIVRRRPWQKRQLAMNNAINVARQARQTPPSLTRHPTTPLGAT
jgi:hypothetical protein